MFFCSLCVLAEHQPLFAYTKYFNSNETRSTQLLTKQPHQRTLLLLNPFVPTTFLVYGAFRVPREKELVSWLKIKTLKHPTPHHSHNHHHHHHGATLNNDHHHSTTTTNQTQPHTSAVACSRTASFPPPPSPAPSAADDSPRPLEPFPPPRPPRGTGGSSSSSPPRESSSSSPPTPPPPSPTARRPSSAPSSCSSNLEAERKRARNIHNPKDNPKGVSPKHTTRKWEGGGGGLRGCGVACGYVGGGSLETPQTLEKNKKKKKPEKRFGGGVGRVRGRYGYAYKISLYVLYSCLGLLKGTHTHE